MSEDDVSLSRGRKSRDINDAIVALTRQRVGRGPVKARVTIDGDSIFVVLHETLTKGEQTLVDNDHEDEVMALRRAFQQVIGPEYCEAVERITGRKVVTFMSTNHASPDNACEVFLLDGPVES